MTKTNIGKAPVDLLDDRFIQIISMPKSNRPNLYDIYALDATGQIWFWNDFRGVWVRAIMTRDYTPLKYGDKSAQSPNERGDLENT